jgi:hypothetical protein
MWSLISYGVASLNDRDGIPWSCSVGIRGYATPGEGPVRLVLALVLMAKKSRKKKARKKSAANHGKRPNS